MTTSTESQIVRQLIASCPLAISTPNKQNRLPLQLAMQSRQRRGGEIDSVILTLVLEYPQAVLLDASVDNIKLFVHVLGCIALSNIKNDDGVDRNGVDEDGGGVHGAAMDDATKNEAGADDECKPKRELHVRFLTTMFILIRGRPDVLSLSGYGIPRLKEGREFDFRKRSGGKRSICSIKMAGNQWIISLDQMFTGGLLHCLFIYKVIVVVACDFL